MQTVLLVTSATSRLHARVENEQSVETSRKKSPSHTEREMQFSTAYLKAAPGMLTTSVVAPGMLCIS